MFAYFLNFRIVQPLNLEAYLCTSYPPIPPIIIKEADNKVPLIPLNKAIDSRITMPTIAAI